MSLKGTESESCPIPSNMKNITKLIFKNIPIDIQVLETLSAMSLCQNRAHFAIKKKVYMLDMKPIQVKKKKNRAPFFLRF